jgi:predicted alpha/beta hydrolase family esterase
LSFKKKQVLFIQGGGENGYEADAKMVDSRRGELGNDYELRYPELQSEEGISDFGWPGQIGKAIHDPKGDIILIGHSLGASLILKYLSETNIQKTITGIFLLATPFWNGDEDWVKGLMLQHDFADRLPGNIPIFLYHCRDDEEVPFKHFLLYVQKLPHAIVHEMKKGGHQFNNDLGFVAGDIKNL